MRDEKDAWIVKGFVSLSVQIRRRKRKPEVRDTSEKEGSNVGLEKGVLDIAINPCFKDLH
jgi:hypothetical protein